MSKCKFAFKSEAKIQELQQIRLKKKSESKVNWVDRACNDWHSDRWLNFNYDIGIYFADLYDLRSLTKENFEHLLCRFIPEVMKVKGEGPYPGKTLYQMILALQKYLNINKVMWYLVDDPNFIDLHTLLDNVM